MKETILKVLKSYNISTDSLGEVISESDFDLIAKEIENEIKNLDKATEVEPEQVKRLLCEVCGHELLHEQARLNDMHVGCAEKKFLAYCITINGSTEYHKNKKSFYESLNPLIEEIGDDNYMIHITRNYITNIKYKNLPENEGF